ncbi:sensor histidine kinase [Paenibacillus glycanilyticus]|uniref:sensor histidine kinase n=1 Tax=Paenibacillus glycanilyticus TaxID=126569 RepID=UPI0020401DE3|nr:sensor histidine kinase [Paenibacillus glycanilyticus]MCM3628403.1 sensor histidine kinase [Paenibacillus glycanilyticus]
MMDKAMDFVWRSPTSLRWLFGLKLIYDLVLTGIFYFENSTAIFWRLTYVVFSLLVFFFLYMYYSHLKKNWLLHLLIIDFLVSASYGYIFIDGKFPNHLFNGITALAIFMFVKNTRMLIMTCVALLMLYFVTMGSIDWYFYHRFDVPGYFVSSSFIVFACIVSSLIHYHQRANSNTKQLYEQLMKSHEQLQEYASKAEEWAAVQERVRIARDIHDTVGHKLTALLVQMQVARKLSGVDSMRSEQAYLECEELIRASLQEVRLSVRAIQDESITATSLNTSLTRLSEEFTKFAKVHTVFRAVGTPVSLPGNLQLTAYRIVQESLTNAQKHGHAANAAIVLTYAESGFSISIQNDGILPAELKPGFGLIHLQERVREGREKSSFAWIPCLRLKLNFLILSRKQIRRIKIDTRIQGMTFGRGA